MSENGKLVSKTHIQKRVQRKRVRGWHMPPNTIYVGRPTQWGNPFSRSFTPKDLRTESAEERPVALANYEFWLRKELEVNPSFLEPLKGKDLACWCRLDQPCHADILLKFLNAKEGVVS